MLSFNTLGRLDGHASKYPREKGFKDYAKHCYVRSPSFCVACWCIGISTAGAKPTGRNGLILGRESPAYAGRSDAAAAVLLGGRPVTSDCRKDQRLEELLPSGRYYFLA